jgi:hypothetical protein
MNVHACLETEILCKLRCMCCKKKKKKRKEKKEVEAVFMLNMLNGILTTVVPIGMEVHGKHCKHRIFTV